MTTLNGIIELNNSNFNEEIKSGLTLVDFWAPWCGPCRLQGPILEEVKRKIQDKAKIAKVNVDDNPDIAQTYGIISIPTLILYKDGKAVKQFVGVQSEPRLTNEINSNL
ncbi:MAG: thioredoxin [Spirochaetes bacterium]|nr:thioredoxin [Spirochaetota bacterium]